MEVLFVWSQDTLGNYVSPHIVRQTFNPDRIQRKHILKGSERCRQSVSVVFLLCIIKEYHSISHTLCTQRPKYMIYITILFKYFYSSLYSTSIENIILFTPLNESDSQNILYTLYVCNNFTLKINIIHKYSACSTCVFSTHKTFHISYKIWCVV